MGIRKEIDKDEIIDLEREWIIISVKTYTVYYIPYTVYCILCTAKKSRMIPIEKEKLQNVL